MEEAVVPIEGAEKRPSTQNGWPHREGKTPTTREGAPTSLRSDRDLGQTPTRQGDPIAKTLTMHQEGGRRAFVPIED